MSEILEKLNPGQTRWQSARVHIIGNKLGDSPRSGNSPRPRLVVVVNSAIALGFVEGQLEFFQNKGFDVTVLCPERRDGEWEVPGPATEISIVKIPMERKIAPLQDLESLWRLWRTMRKLRPTVTNVGTPKAGLLGGFAAWLNRVPCRVYTLHGLRFETAKGLKRRLLVYAERLACSFAHRVVCVSHSAREKAIACRLAPRKRIVVLKSGSCNGVDASRFAPNPELLRRAAELREQLGIPEKATVILFVGRLTCDKGIPELLRAFSLLDRQFRDLRLLLVGCFEKEDPLPGDIHRVLKTHRHVVFAGAIEEMPAVYALADVVALPSHREGLPLVVLEAQAAGKPVIGANATGIVDIIADGQTGLLFPIGYAPALARALARLIGNKALARRLGQAGQEQVRRKFQQEQIWEALYEEYFTVLQTKRTPTILRARSAKRDNLLGRRDQERCGSRDVPASSSEAIESRA